MSRVEVVLDTSACAPRCRARGHTDGTHVMWLLEPNNALNRTRRLRHFFVRTPVTTGQLA
jgi:hypothetical protein